MPLVFRRKRFCLEGFIVVVNRMWWSFCILPYHQLLKKREAMGPWMYPFTVTDSENMSVGSRRFSGWVQNAEDDFFVILHEFYTSDNLMTLISSWNFCFEFHKSAFCHARKHGILCGFCTPEVWPKYNNWRWNSGFDIFWEIVNVNTYIHHTRAVMLYCWVSVGTCSSGFNIFTMLSQHLTYRDALDIKSNHFSAS